MRLGKLLVIAMAAMGLSGCIGAGMMAARSAPGGVFKEKSAAERIAAEQDKAISAVHGGISGTPIEWNDAKSGIEGRFLQDPAGEEPEGCHKYRQTISIGSETLEGQIVSCLQKDGSWKLAGEKPGSRFDLSGFKGPGQLALSASENLFKKKSPAERIAAGQEEAISAVHGGSPETPIVWSDVKSGIRGAFLPDQNGDTPEDCHKYRQTIIIGGQTLQGEIVACLQKDGSWKHAGEKSGSGE
jgi:surface antigen